MIGVTERKSRGIFGKRKGRISGNGEKPGNSCKKLEQNQQQNAGKGVHEQRKKRYRRVERRSGFARKIHAEHKRCRCYKNERNKIEQDGIPNAGAEQKRYRRARNKTYAKVVPDNNALEPLKILHVKGLIQSELRA